MSKFKYKKSGTAACVPARGRGLTASEVWFLTQIAVAGWAF